VVIVRTLQADAAWRLSGRVASLLTQHLIKHRLLHRPELPRVDVTIREEAFQRPDRTGLGFF
jgi:hypothetical protein